MPQSPATPNPFKYITATSQQTRFHIDTLESQTEVDLHGVSISIGEKELLGDVDLRLKEGVRYALVGRSVHFSKASKYSADLSVIRYQKWYWKIQSVV